MVCWMEARRLSWAVLLPIGSRRPLGSPPLASVSPFIGWQWLPKWSCDCLPGIAQLSSALARLAENWMQCLRGCFASAHRHVTGEPYFCASPLHLPQWGSGSEGKLRLNEPRLITLKHAQPQPVILSLPSPQGPNPVAGPAWGDFRAAWAVQRVPSSPNL